MIFCMRVRVRAVGSPDLYAHIFPSQTFLRMVPKRYTTQHNAHGTWFTVNKATDNFRIKFPKLNTFVH